MQFQTHVNIPEQEPKISYQSKVLLLGSCFSENIGEKFRYYQFQHLQNPFGILFHPFALEQVVQRVVHQQEYTAADVFQHQGVWSCFDAHSRLNRLSQPEILHQLNTALQQSHQFLKTATHLIITLGTAWVYQHQQSGKYVANCHKIPQTEFQKELSGVNQLQQSLTNTAHLIAQLNPKAQIIFTLSPVRHLKDGLVENQLSKAHLLSALQPELKKNQQASYFPSYEIMLDQLRDYRFYKADMLHPNATAVNYIWQRFQDVWFAKSTLPTMKNVQQIQQGLAHKAFQPTSAEHQQFLERLDQKIKALQTDFPFMDF